jgi:hypothetical protein
VIHAVIAGTELQPSLSTFGAQRRLDFAAGVIDRIDLRRLHRSSPLEIAIQFMGVATMGVILFDRIVASFNRVQTARVDYARGRVKIEASELERLLIKAARHDLSAALGADGAKPNSALERAVAAASRTLVALETVTLGPESDLAGDSDPL